MNSFSGCQVEPTRNDLSSKQLHTAEILGCYLDFNSSEE